MARLTVSVCIWGIAEREGAIMMHWFIYRYVCVCVYKNTYVYLFSCVTRPEGPAVQELEPSKATFAASVWYQGS